MSKTLIILNPHAAGGRAGKLWTHIEPMLWDKLGELVLAVTQNPAEVAQHLDHAYASGLTRVVSIGGLIAETLRRINNEESVSYLFNEDLVSSGACLP